MKSFQMKCGLFCGLFSEIPGKKRGMMVYIVQWDDKSLIFTSQSWPKNREYELAFSTETKQLWALTEP